MQLSKLSGSILSGLHCFLIAADQMSFTRAAETLCLTQSAVSHKIKNLEEILDVQLFIRQHRKLVLTDEGQRLKQVLASNFGDIIHEIRDLKSAELSGDLTISVPPTFAQTWLVPRLVSFIDKYPNVRIHLRTRNDLVDFKTESYDCAIYFGNGEYPNLAVDKLLEESMFPVCSHEYAVKYQLYHQPENLIHCLLLHDAAPWARAGRNDEWQFWAQHFKVALPDNGCTFDRADLAIKAAATGMGVAMARQSFVAEQLASSRLVSPFDMTMISAHSYYVVCRKDMQTSPKINAFKNWLFSEINN